MRQDQKSVIDYILISKKNKESVKSITIDDIGGIFNFPHDHNMDRNKPSLTHRNITKLTKCN